MKVLQSVVPILGLVLLVAGCDTDPVLDALLDNMEVAGSTEDRIISDGSVDSEILAEVKDSMDLSRAYAKEHLGIDPPGCNVFIGTDPAWMTDRYFEAFNLLGGGGWPEKMQFFADCESGAIAEGGLSSLFIVECDGLSSEFRKWISAHEWWHTNVQYYLLNAFCCTDSDRMQMVGPLWLFEGSAEVWASFVVNDFANNLEHEKAWRQRRVPTDFNLLDLNTGQGWREASDQYKHVARDLAAWMLVETAGLPSFVDFYRQLGEYFASEAAEVGLESTSQSNQMVPFRNTFFDPPERYQKLNEIFQSAFGRTMEAFAEEFRESLANPIRTEKVTPPLNREEILAWPAEGATDEEKQQHWDLVRAASVNVNLLDISGCAPDPVVIEVGLGESIEIKNSDTTDHTLDHGAASITIPAGGTRDVVVSDFLGIEGGIEGDALAGYACDGRAAGVFYVNPNLFVKPSEK